MANWADCEALAMLSTELPPADWPETEFPENPPWLRELCESIHEYAHDIATYRGVAITCHLWLQGDHWENRCLPMPLRYAAHHPSTPQAILSVLGGGLR